MKIIAVLAVYAAAMALAEAAAVVYLRELYYPAGFFISSAEDLKIIPPHILKVELWREAATIVMLLAVSFLAFDRLKEKIWAFVLAFSLWDIGYYLFLYIVLRWPPAFSTPDVYFLIPWPWIGPVWFPLLLFGTLGIISFRQLVKSPF